MDLLLRNANLVTQNPQRDIFKGDLLIRGNRIESVGESLENPGVEELDLSGLTVIPGLIQTHVHLCQALFRNLADDLTLLDWLRYHIWPMEQAHDEKSLRVSAQLGLFEMLRCGVTSILDMGAARHMDVVFEELVRSGIRGFSGKVMMDAGDQPYRETTREALESTEALLKRWHGAENGRIHYALAPRFALTCSNALWEGIDHLARRYGVLIHTHASENRQEVELVRQQTGYHNVEFFVRKGLASNRLCLAHCIWLTEEEIHALKEYRVNVLHCPSANLKLGSGFAPVPRYLKEGINVSLGSDGAPCNNNMDIFVDMRLAALIHKPNFGVTSIKARDVFDMVTLAGARTLGMADQLGSLEPGKLADLAVLDLNKVHTTPAEDFYSQIVYSAQSRDVVHVMVDGKWVVQNGQPLAYSEEEIVNLAWQECNALLKRLA
ncbi:MAG: 5'-deoxyadenosine deaminase [Calditrichaeota bacterium]|nr:MAG: 5'-deoxyadenosine deaminase [Calditrichota bacterium]